MFTGSIKTSTRILFIVIFSVFLMSIMVLQAASLDIPDAGKMGTHAENIRVNDLAPYQCSGIYVSTLLTGSAVTGSAANELITGTSGDDILTGGNASVYWVLVAYCILPQAITIGNYAGSRTAITPNNGVVGLGV